MICSSGKFRSLHVRSFLWTGLSHRVGGVIGGQSTHGKPMQNGNCEAFNGRMRDELLSETLKDSV